MKLSLGPYEAAVRKRASALAPEIERIWRHDSSFWGGDATRAKSIGNRLGWLEVASTMRGNAADIKAFAEQVRADGFRDAVVLGMGGSSLAPEVLWRSIGSVRREPRHYPVLHVLDSTDPATIGAVARAIDPAHTLFFVSSKSGTTIEALSLLAYFEEIVREAKGDRAGENFVAITDNGTPLQKLAGERGFRRVFVNPSDIGGRYSALSYFGLVPAAVCGVDAEALLARGIAAQEAARSPESEALLLGAALGELALAGHDKCTLVASPAIASFGLWVEQLIAESTGKEAKGILPVDGEPLAAPAHYGDDRFFVYLRLNGDQNGGLDAHLGALDVAGQPVIRIDLDDPYDLGREFFRWEFAVAIAGRVLGINPFDEPNVQESKDNTGRVLEALATTGTIEIDTVSAHTPEFVPAIDQLLSAIDSGGYFAITAYRSAGGDAAEEFSRMRKAILDGYHVATTLGYGPRFLHSTGQFHKGGPQNGAFLQVLGEIAVNADEIVPDIAIPGRSFTFGQLKRAQAAGDRESLLKRGRTVVTVDLGDDYLNLEALCQLITIRIAKDTPKGG